MIFQPNLQGIRSSKFQPFIFREGNNSVTLRISKELKKNIDPQGEETKDISSVTETLINLEDLSLDPNQSIKLILVGGFKPSEKYQSKWESSPNRGENKKIFETTT